MSDATKVEAMNAVHPAKRYDAVDDLGLITTYFNPLGYHSKRRNYEAFKDAIVGSGLQLLTVECAFGTAPFVLPRSTGLVQVRARDLMWQKERLLNLAIEYLPRHCTKVAWLDCDVLFENPGWAVETSKTLDRCSLVQPFATAIRLPEGTCQYRSVGELWRGFAATYAESPQYARDGTYAQHGETGFAWAARRDVVADCRLYDACITGGADHAMAHAMCGGCGSHCLDRLLEADTASRQHFVRWAQTFYDHVGGKVGFVPGAALHLWHGERSNRRYAERHKILKDFAFDPESDLRIGAGGCWEWASRKPELHQSVVEYFAGRQEDGSAAAPPTRELPASVA
jgi:hypothetical protein